MAFDALIIAVLSDDRDGALSAHVEDANFRPLAVAVWHGQIEPALVRDEQ